MAKRAKLVSGKTQRRDHHVTTPRIPVGLPQQKGAFADSRILRKNLADSRKLRKLLKIRHLRREALLGCSAFLELLALTFCEVRTIPVSEWYKFWKSTFKLGLDIPSMVSNFLLWCEIFFMMKKYYTVVLNLEVWFNSSFFFLLSDIFLLLVFGCFLLSALSPASSSSW